MLADPRRILGWAAKRGDDYKSLWNFLVDRGEFPSFRCDDSIRDLNKIPTTSPPKSNADEIRQRFRQGLPYDTRMARVSNALCGRYSGVLLDLCDSSDGFARTDLNKTAAAWLTAAPRIFRFRRSVRQRNFRSIA